MPTRRTVLLGAAATAAALGCPAIIRPARAAEKVTLITPFGFDADFIDLMNASSGGHFAKEGLDATVLGATGTVQHIQQVIAGQADFGRFSGIDFIRAVGAKDAPLRALATMRQNSGFHVVSLKDNPVKSGADLKGKTIGLLSIGGTTQTFIEVLLAKNGIVKDESKLLVTGNSPGEVDLIRQGRIDCFICTYSVAFILRRTAQPLEFLPVDVPVPAPGQVLHATRTTLEQRPELALKVLRALKASMNEIMTQPIAPIYARAAKDFEIPGAKDIDLLAAQTKQAIGDNWLLDGKPETLLANLPARWQSGCDALRTVGFADVKDPTALYTNSVLDKL
jgi:ABC-type nitrate/sulfonate/bicarbonate transport system substrate-binding protein